jgi:hypothetical protein
VADLSFWPMMIVLCTLSPHHMQAFSSRTKSIDDAPGHLPRPVFRLLGAAQKAPTLVSSSSSRSIINENGQMDGSIVGLH